MDDKNINSLDNQQEKKELLDEKDNTNSSEKTQDGKENRPKRPEKRKDSGQPKKKKKKKNIVFLVIRKLFTVILTTLLSLFLIMVITGTIVATALTMYVLEFMEETNGITIQDMEMSYNSYIYGHDASGELVVLYEVNSEIQRIPVTIDEIPQHVRDAFVYTEDERFYSHDGVDYKRTFAAFLNMFINIYDTDQGGSTITQQLVKNLTGDDEKSPSRKIREIFRAMQLEKTYSKDEILESYLNYIGFGGPINGIQLASMEYFGKNVSEINTAEAAALAAIPKSPNTFGLNLEENWVNNKSRQQYVLWQIYKNGAITYDEYQVYVNQKLIYKDSDEYKQLHPEEFAKDYEKSEEEATSWIVDAAIYEFAAELAKMYNIDDYEAIRRFNSGGYQIYVNADLEMQEYLDNKFLELDNILDSSSVVKYSDLDDDGESEEIFPQVGFAAIDYNGNIMAYGAAIGKKTESLAWNYAADETRQVGSAIKPVSTYGLAMLTDMIHWGSAYVDMTHLIYDGDPWPTNYSSDSSFSVSGATLPIYVALQKSYNTIPVKLCIDLTPEAVFNFCTENLGMKLDPTDMDYSPLSVGALTYGISIENLVNAFVPYGNGGTYYNAHIISKVEQGNHNLVYENNGDPHEAVDSQTAWVMNRLMKNVVDNGTGTLAQISGYEICGKTGTTSNWYDLTFVGMNPEFASGIWVGYREINSLPSSVKSARVWQNIIGDYIREHVQTTSFTPDPEVIEAPMCSSSWMIASSNCPRGSTGYWKTSNAPVCTGGHYTAPTTEDTTTDPNAETPTDGNNENQPTNPPADNSPTDNPPVDNPPVDNPPADNPPADNPPVEE